MILDLKRLAGAGALALAAGCGDGDMPAPPQNPPPANAAPQITSGSSASVAENALSTGYVAAASDPNGDAVSFSISGGADAARFAIDPASGALSFIAPPDFEAPDDTDGDNVYVVEIRASDGALSDTQTVAVTVTDLSATVNVRRVASGFAEPLFLTGAGGGGCVLIVEKGGVIELLDPATGAVNATPFLDVSAEVSTNGERGLLGLALAPDFASSGAFYVNLTNLAGDTEIRRYAVMAGDPERADPTSAALLLTIGQPQSNHNGGWIGFGPDGMLYIAMGDGGGSGDPAGAGQDNSVLLGKILRIDPSADDFPGDPDRNYAIPADNPFAGGGGAPEIWATGLRNPFRASFDRAAGDLYIGDVGQNAIEEIDLAPAGTGGLNFGWSAREGTMMFNGADSAAFTPPIAEYAHGFGPREGNSVTGGYVHRGNAQPIVGHYVFGDFITGNIWSIPVADIAQGTTIASGDFIIQTDNFSPAIGTIDNIASFGEDDSGALYIVDFDGEIFRIENEP